MVLHPPELETLLVLRDREYEQVGRSPQHLDPVMLVPLHLFYCSDLGGLWVMLLRDRQRKQDVAIPCCETEQLLDGQQHTHPMYPCCQE